MPYNMSASGVSLKSTMTAFYFDYAVRVSIICQEHAYFPAVNNVLLMGQTCTRSMY